MPSITAPLRLSHQKVEPRPILRVGDHVRLAHSRCRWTVRGVTRAGRFVILTQPFNVRHTVLYTVVDLDRGVRGKDDHYGLGYEDDQEIEDAVHMFQHTEDDDGPNVTNNCEFRGDWCAGRADVSFRAGNHVRLDFRAVNNVAVNPDGTAV